MQNADVLIIGAGIIGLATAYQIQRRNPHLKIILLEKECKAALHQSSRNSGVIHSGVYYRPGSLKAVNCVRGKKELLFDIDELEVSRIIVVTSSDEVKDGCLKRGKHALKLLDQMACGLPLLVFGTPVAPRQTGGADHLDVG